MTDSIFLTIKNALGIEVDFTGFDAEILLGVNTALMNLTQLGVGSSAGFAITGPSETWTQFIGQSKKLEGVKSYVQIKTKMLFDPPSSSFIIDAHTRLLQELEWRLMTQAEEDAATPSTT